MEKAKQAVSGFLSRDGKHDTTVHENVAPAITNENVTRTQHENATKAVDREVHQDHHHTSVQPIKHSEVLPEQHTHNMGQVEERHFKHGNDSHIRDRLETEKAQFKNTREVGDVQHSQSAGKDIVGEHIHHHVHETIQPVIQKETIQPSVVHTTIPVHEVHHNEAKHHTASALPAMSMDDFKRSGGHLSGRDERRDEFQGEPKTVGTSLGGHGASGTTSLTHPEGTTGHTGSHGSYGIGGSNTHNSSTTHGTHGTHGTSGVAGSSGVGSTTGTSGLGGPSGIDTNTGTHTKRDSAVGGLETERKKPSLMDRINPSKDANGDGKAGFMK